MKSTVHKRQIKSKNRKSQQGRKRRATTTRKTARPIAPASGMAAFVAGGMSVDVDILPEWRDLVPKNQKSRFATPVRKKVNSFIDRVSTAQFALALLIAALAMGLYVRHVFATQETLSRLEQMRRENLQLQLEYNELKGTVDRALSPNQIYHRAKGMGLEPGVESGGSIRFTPPED